MFIVVVAEYILLSKSSVLFHINNLCASISYLQQKKNKNNKRFFLIFFLEFRRNIWDKKFQSSFFFMIVLNYVEVGVFYI